MTFHVTQLASFVEIVMTPLFVVAMAVVGVILMLVMMVVYLVLIGLALGPFRNTFKRVI